MKITKETKIGELISEKPKAAELLMESGMGCVGCPCAQMETLEEGCKGHGMNDEDVDVLVKALGEMK